MTVVGYVITAILWIVVIIPTYRAVRQVMKTTKPRDLIPNVTRVPASPGIRIVSDQRARMEPGRFVRCSPWCWKEKA